jgi:hypothetical protein
VLPGRIARLPLWRLVLVAAQAAKGSGLLLLVAATLRRIVHPPSTGGDGRPLPALVEYRLTTARVVGRD